MAPRDIPEDQVAQLEEPTEEVPKVSPALIDWLSRAYPPRCKLISEPVEAHMLYAGHVALVGKLKAISERQKGQHKLRYQLNSGRVIDETTELPSPPSRPQAKPSKPRPLNRG